MTLQADMSDICNDVPEELSPENFSTQEVVISRSELEVAMATSLDMLAGVAMPDTCTLLFPETYHVMWQLVTEAVKKSRGFDRIYLGIPRGFCKTTFIRLLVALIVFNTDRNFPLLLNSIGDKAENSLASITNILDAPNIQAIYGNWRNNMQRDTMNCKQFTFRGRKQVLGALGITSSIRGLNVDDRRPDVMIYDDIQDWANAASPTLSDELITHFTGTVMKAGSKFRCTHIFVGNMYPFEHALPDGRTSGSILRLLKKNPAWTGIIAGGILADGQSFWPELQSVEQLLEEYRNDESLGRGAIFLSEILNDDTAMARSGLDTTRVPHVNPALFEEPHQGGFIIIDPSGRKKKSNNTEIGAFVMYDGLPYFRSRTFGVMSPKDTIKNAINVASELGIGLIAVEAVAYQETLLFWFQEVIDEMHIAGIELVAVYPGGISKNARIMKMFPQLVPGTDSLAGTADIMLGPAVRSMVLDQACRFNPTTQNNTDDLLDILAYVYKVIEQFGDYIAACAIINMSSAEAIPVLSVEDNSVF